MISNIKNFSLENKKAKNKHFQHFNKKNKTNLKIQMKCKVKIEMK